MLAMIVAAAAIAAPASPFDARRVFGEPPAAAACKAPGRYETDWEPALLYRQSDRIRPKRLEQLPKPDYEKAVLRTVEGCSAPLVVGVSVGR